MSIKSLSSRVPINGRVAMAAIMLAIFAAMILMAAAYPYKSRLLPWVIGIPGTVLALIQLVHEITAPSGSETITVVDHGETVTQIEPAADADEAAVKQHQELVLIGYLVLLVVSHVLLGFWIASPLFVAVFLRLYEGASWRFVIISAAATWLTLYVVFDQLLTVGVFEGLLTPYVTDLFE
ncbi:MAG: tripartite tricarboxylate transporter TctB family protein [Hyphomicrobiales bacterium]|nr:tripartite tricarboxylate transporter TctB family protein [Hyphomicrobiales bacterium]